MNRLIACVFVLLFLGGFVSATKALQTKPSTAARPEMQAPTHNAPTGDEVFKANCSRCHMPPMAISPRITGTVIMHMRTRARLSRQDEQLLLKFMAP
jgi:cytochrome c5